MGENHFSEQEAHFVFRQIAGKPAPRARRAAVRSKYDKQHSLEILNPDRSPALPAPCYCACRRGCRLPPLAGHRAPRPQALKHAHPRGRGPHERRHHRLQPRKGQLRRRVAGQPIPASLARLFPSLRPSPPRPAPPPFSPLGALDAPPRLERYGFFAWGNGRADRREEKKRAAALIST